MKLVDLVLDVKTGRLSHTKLWANIGYAAMTAAFLHTALTTGLTDLLLLTYGGITVGGAAGSKFLSMRYHDAKPD